MKKTLVVIALLFVFAAVAMAAPPITSVTAPSAVTLTANVPDFISLTGSQQPNVVFTFAPNGTLVQGSGMPSYNLAFNIAKSEHITVCAYLDGPLQGTVGSNKIPSGEVMEGFSQQTFDGNCGGNPHAITVADGLKGYNAGTQENMILVINSGSVPPVPDTYTAQLNVVALIY